MSQQNLPCFNFLKAFLIFSFLSLANLQVQAEVLSDSISCSDVEDASTCSSNNLDVNATAMVNIANELMQIVSSGGVTAPSFCSDNQGLLECNVSPNAQSTLIMTCTPDFVNQRGSCVARDLSAQNAVQLDCNVSAGSCSSNIDTELLCDADQSLCESMLARSKYCDLGFCQVPENTPVAATFTDVITAKNRLPDNLQSMADSFLSCDATSGQMAKICAAALASNDTNAVIALVDALMPKKPDAPIDTAVVNLNQAQMTIQGHLYRLRSNTAGPSTSSMNTTAAQLYYVDGQWLPAGTLLASNNNSANDAMPTTMEIEQSISDDGRLGLFVSAAYIDAEENDSVLESASETDISMLTMGLDYRIRNDLVAGMALTYADSTTKFDISAAESSRLDGESFSLSTYGSMYFGDWFIDGSLLYSFNDYKQGRQIDCAQTLCNLGIGDIKDSYNSDFDGSQYGLSISAGHDFNFSAFSFTPFAQYSIGSIKTDAYSETPGDVNQTAGAQLQLSEQQRNVGSISVGSYFHYVFSTQAGIFIPNARLSYNYNVQDNVNNVEGRFAANPNSAGFSLKSNEVDNSYVVIAAGLNVQLKNGNAGFFEIESIEDYDNLTQLRYTAGWRWEI